MSANYWIEQHKKEVLVTELKSYLETIYRGVYPPNIAQQIISDISNYLINNKKTAYKVHVKISLDTGDIIIEIP
jgi:hypothetical protein